MTRSITKKITHIEHLDDMCMYKPDLCINYLKSIQTDKLTGSVKWDGAPAIIFGDIDGTKFCATKSFFNKTPQYYTTIQDILNAQWLSSELSIILIETLLAVQEQTCSNEAWQGDVLWCNTAERSCTELKTQMNTVQYKFTKEHKDFNRMVDSNLGVAVHSKYTFTDSGTELCEVDRNPQSTSRVYFLEDVRVPIYMSLHDAELIETLEKLKLISGNPQNPRLFEYFRKYKTQCLENGTTPDDFNAFCSVGYADLSTNLLNSSKTIARANAMERLKTHFYIIERSEELFNLLVKITKLCHIHVHYNIFGLKVEGIEADHEGVVVSVNGHFLKYINKIEFTAKNNLNRKNYKFK